MPMIQDILADKPAHVHTVQADDTVLETTRLMNEHKIGAVVVMEGNAVGGIFTERDVLRRVVAVERAPSQVKVGEVMTRELICCLPSDDIDDISRIMRDRRIRHLPVISKSGALLGLVSIGDINAFHASSQEAHITFLSEYVYGRA